jgi:RNA polymerase sigma factor (sigma-70 family)
MQTQFETIYREHYQKVFGLSLGYVNGDYDLAADLTQEVFVKVWEHLKGFRKEASVSTWIYRITINTCLVYHRKKRALPLTTDVVASEEEDKAALEQRFSSMYACINKLPETHKTIILLELEDIPQAEIAAIVGVSHQALRTRLSRIKKELSKCVNNEKL